ncbi:MAG TPA: molybdopterin-binding protein [Symbiobacteriaceae bacterium]|jgi:molybdopterin biosynthesis enzyme|nr:molybdopterin-binding protein [Symbiobacteriaceae bacterium]
MKVVATTEAVGMILCHDLTRIVPGEGKGPAFRKGHVVREEDIPLLLSMGKEHLYVWEVQPGLIHEEEAAQRLAKAAVVGGITYGAPSEGKVSLKAAHAGLLRIDAAKLEQINSIGEVTVATQRDGMAVEAGKLVAACKVTPLVIPEVQVAAAEALGTWIEVKPFQPRPTAVIVTGSEVFKGRIPDKFGPVVEAKLAAYGCPVVYKAYSDDQAEMTVEHIRKAQEAGAELILCTGGMSVDPDDATPGAIRQSGARIVTYGAPVLPGSMFMMAYLEGDRPVMGLPGAVMFESYTLFDVVLPMVLAGEVLTKQDFIRMGHGGLIHK